MRKQLITILLTIAAFLFCTNSCAANGDTSNGVVVKIFFCPAISSIKKNLSERTWSAPGGWKSYDMSFMTHITSFTGAQWNGATVGQITCVYQGIPKTAFPVLLVYHTLALEPSPGQWTKKIKSVWGKNQGGYRNCFSKSQLNCPFKVRLKSQQDNIYQGLENLKNENQ